jgi:hypothetical protein
MLLAAPCVLALASLPVPLLALTTLLIHVRLPAAG